MPTNPREPGTCSSLGRSLKLRNMANVAWKQRSQKPGAISCGHATRWPRRLLVANAMARRRASGAKRTSASVKSRKLPVASLAPAWHAWVLPSQPSGSSAIWRTRNDACSVARRSRTAPVPSLGAVVHGDDLEIGVVLRQQRAERLLDVGGLVARRNDDRQPRPSSLRRLLDVDVAEAAEPAVGRGQLPKENAPDECRPHREKDVHKRHQGLTVSSILRA